MKLFRIGCFTLCFLLIGTFSVWAGGSQSSKNASGATVVRVWGNDAHNKDQYMQVIDNYNKTVGAQKNIVIEYTVYGTDYWTGLDVALAADEEPDIFKSNPKTQQFVEMGKALPLNELPDFAGYMQEFAPFQSEGWSMIDGVVYNLPIYQATFGMAYNKDLLSRIGMSEPPKTWDEFERACIAISRLEPGKTFGTAIPLKLVDFHDNYVMVSAIPSTGHFAFDSATGRYRFSDLVPYFEMLLRIKNAGGMFPGMETLDDDTLRAQFSEGNVGFLFSGSWVVGVFYDQFPAKQDWAIAPMPVRSLNGSFNGVAHVSTLFTVSSQVRKRGNQTAVAEALKLLTSKELRMLNYTMGKNIPSDPRIANDAAPAERVQWNQFAQVGATSVLKPSPPDALFSVEGDNYYTVFSQILAGVAQPAAALADLEKRYNDALDRVVNAGRINRNSYIDPGIGPKLKEGH
jgi:ABC-type glycerol-3-phosphate transport system substrate-binding protein